jgi:hypothetical protein
MELTYGNDVGLELQKEARGNSSTLIVMSF